MIPIFPNELEKLNKADPYFYNTDSIYIPNGNIPGDDKCELLLHFEGVNNSTHFIDSSKNSFAISTSGTPLLNNSLTPPFGVNYLNLNNDGDYIYLSDNEAWSLGSGDFTVEAIIYPTYIGATYNNHMVVGNTTNTNAASGWSINLTNSGYIQFSYYNGSSWYNIADNTSPLSINNWYHIAAVNKGGIISLYKNGTKIYSSAITGSINNATDPLRIGRDGHTTFIKQFLGNIKTIAIYKGFAKYTQSFTLTNTFISTTPCNDPFWYNNYLVMSGIGPNNNQYPEDHTLRKVVTRVGTPKFTNNLMYFSTGNYYTVPYTSFGAYDFSIELDYKAATTPDGCGLLTLNYPGTGDTFGIGFCNGTAGSAGGDRLFFGHYTSSTWSSIIDSASTAIDEWINVKVIRLNNVIYLYKNNSLINSYNISTYSFPGSGTLKIGSRWDTSGTVDEFNGNIKNLRITNYIARDITDQFKYVPNFMEIISKGSIYTSASTLPSIGKDSRVVGTKYINTVSSKIVYPENTQTTTSDFTVELWYLLPSATDAYKNIIIPDSGTTGFTIRYGNSGFGYKLQISTANGSVSTIYSCDITQQSSYGIWNHVALVRKSQRLYLYFNGRLKMLESGANPTTYPYESFANSDSWTSIPHASAEVYIKSFRLSNVARYTGKNINIPNIQFPTRGGNI